MQAPLLENDHQSEAHHLHYDTEWARRSHVSIAANGTLPASDHTVLSPSLLTATDPRSDSQWSTDARLSTSTVIYYSHGHVLNDLCSACWFTYLLVMLRARGIVDIKAGIVLLAGQVADAMATPLCGWLSDRSAGMTVLGHKFGRRQTWYIFGSVIVAVNFFFVFAVALPVLINPSCPEWALIIYYCLAASLFNVGWAAVQVAHMAMVPELSANEHERVTLNSARYGESVIANILVFIILAILTAIGLSDDVDRWTYLAIIALVLGAVATVVFMVGVREKPCLPLQRGGVGSDDSARDGWKLWLARFDFWKVGWIYMCTRITVNVSQSFLVFYLLDTLRMSDMSITVVPCIVYVCSFLAALTMKRANARFGRKSISGIGTVCCLAALAVMFFLQPETSYLVYLAAVLLGVGNGSLMVCSQQLPADLIGSRTAHGAFVFGVFSLADKLANGLAIFFLQMGNTDPDADDNKFTSDPEYIRWSVTILPFISTICGMLMLAFGVDIEAMMEQSKSCSESGMEGEGEGESRSASVNWVGPAGINASTSDGNATSKIEITGDYGAL